LLQPQRDSTLVWQEAAQAEEEQAERCSSSSHSPTATLL